jgi:hypothetical protein
MNAADHAHAPVINAHWISIMTSRTSRASLPPYSLRANNFSSDEFYTDLALFTNEALLRLRSLDAWVDSYRNMLVELRIEEARSSGEYLYELLALGTYWNTYGSAALASNRIATSLLHGLVKLRRRSVRSKDGIDRLRGVLGGVLLHHRAGRPAPAVPSPRDLRMLVRWLEATGDFREEALRLSRWITYLASLPQGETALVLVEVQRIAAWFETEARRTLGEYTGRVESFASEHADKYRFREDRVFCSRKAVEYHLSMVGSEIMNRSFRGEFLARQRKLVGVPGCMRILPKEQCKAVIDPEGDRRCSACNSRCRVLQLTRFAEQYDAGVVIIPHSTDFSRWAERKGLEGREAIVGVACVPALIGGGLELRGNNVAAQCVFLDFPGCRNHWTEEGVATDLNFEQLRRVLEPGQGMGKWPENRGDSSYIEKLRVGENADRQSVV